MRVDEADIEYVEIYGQGRLSNMFGMDKQAYLTHADSLYKKPDGSKLEGLVYKSKDGAFSFKVISNQYLLKTEK